MPQQVKDPSLSQVQLLAWEVLHSVGTVKKKKKLLPPLALPRSLPHCVFFLALSSFYIFYFVCVFA